MIKSLNKRKNKLNEQRCATSRFKDNEGEKQDRKTYKKEKEQVKALCLSAHPGNTIIKRSNRLASSQANFKQEVTVLSEVKINYG